MKLNGVDSVITNGCDNCTDRQDKCDKQLSMQAKQKVIHMKVLRGMITHSPARALRRL